MNAYLIPAGTSLIEIMRNVRASSAQVIRFKPGHKFGRLLVIGTLDGFTLAR